MQHTITLYVSVCTFLLSACGAATSIPTAISATPTANSATPTAAGTQTTVFVPTATEEAISLPFAELGPYAVGVTRNIVYEDPGRGGRKVTITIWYPAIQPEDSAGNGPIADAIPDLANAPFPEVLSSSKVGFIFGPHLVSHGFVYVGVNGQDSKDHWGQWLTDYPLDIVFVLNQIASTPVAGLENVIDTNRAGAMGYSFDGYTSLALSGARVDPEFYLARCSNAAAREPAPPAWWIDYVCNPTGGWDELVHNAGSTSTTGPDGLWKAMTDERIQAVMPMAPEGAWLFGERGLAAVDRPILIVGATADEINIYSLEAAYIFEHLTVPERTMISFVDRGHMMIEEADQVARMKHLAVAFFGYHLQRHEDYSQYFSADFINQFDDLVWGVYQD